MTEIRLLRAARVPWAGRTIAYPKGWTGNVAEDLAAHLCDELGIAKRTAVVPTQRPLPPAADYGDEVTDEHLERIKELVPEEEYEDAKEIGAAEEPERMVPRRRRV